MEARRTRPRQWRAPSTPACSTEDTHRFSVTLSTEHLEAHKLLHRLAREGALTAEQATECAKLIPLLTKDPDWHVVLGVPLAVDRRTILKQVTWYVDNCLASVKGRRTRKRPGRPSTVAAPWVEFERERLMTALQGLRDAWPQISALRKADEVERILRELLWPPVEGTQTVFVTAHMMTVHNPLNVPPPKEFLAGCNAAARKIVNGKLRKPETCLECVWADFLGVKSRTIRDLYRKKPPRK